MKFTSTLITFIVLFFLSSHTEGQTGTTKVQVFYRDTSFRNIVSDESGNVYALSNRKGMVKYDQEKWQNWNGGGTAFAKSSAWQLATKGNEVWVASAGYVFYLGSGAAGNNNNLYGGVLKFDNQNSFRNTYFKGRPVLGQTIHQGPPTRNILGIYIDSTGRPWCAASYQDSITYPAVVNYNARYHYVPGAVGRYNGNNFDFITGADLPDPTGILLGVGNSYKDDNYSIGKRRTCRSITQVGKEMWVGSDGYDQATGNLITAGILRYDLEGNYLSKFDQNNCGIPFGLTNTSMGPWSIYQDKVGRVWVGMNGFKGIAVMDTNNVWVNIGVPANLPSNTVFRSNGISGNDRGEVFFATSNGLLVYKGVGGFLSDTSYRVYTTSDGLTSNSVFGAASGKDGSIWLATDAGINKIVKGDLIVYNLTEDLYNPSLTDQDSVRRIIATYSSDFPQEIIDKDTLFVAADGSRATILKYTGSNPKNMAFRIVPGKSDGNPYTEDQGGHFVVNYSDNDSVRVQYYHPSYLSAVHTIIPEIRGRDLRLKIVDTTVTPEHTVFDIPIQVVLPPVLMVHGIWSDESTWKNLKDYLLTNINYKYRPYELSTPRYPSDMGFSDNYPEIQLFINDLLEQCRKNKISAGKVDVVCHSMGGILTRLYLQDISLYENNIHKLITINTPHSGSPLANIYEDKDSKFQWVLKNSHKIGNPDNGALRDLKIGSPSIDSMLNGDNLNKNIVPTHVIHSTDTLSSTVENADRTINKFIKSPTELNPNVPWDSLSYKVRKSFKKSLFDLKNWLFNKTSCSWDTPLNECLERVFNGKNDFIVSDESQIGGVANEAQTGLTGLWHSVVNKEQPTLSHVLNLLREDANNSDFSMGGFNPIPLKWSPTDGTFHARKGAFGSDSVNIISPAYGATFNRGDSVHVIVRASAGITRIMFAMAYENDLNSWALETPDSVFSFQVPQDVMDRINYQIFAIDNLGNEYFDSSYITITPNPALLVDSIQVDYPGAGMGNLRITVQDSTQITVWGYFNDGVKRNITYQTGLTYTTLSGAVSVSGEGYVKGLVVGFDELIISYQGKSDTIYVEVVPKIVLERAPAETLPVHFTKINARYTGNDVLVQWTTAMEQNNDHFEIEYSTDGNHFAKAGSIAATNFSNGSSYSFDHTGYAQGKNYYRIKQVDIDGKASYSDIVVAIVHSRNNIFLYPNPVTNDFIIDLTKAVNQKVKMVILYNNLGQIILKKTIAAGQTKIHISAGKFAQGIYNVEILDAGNKRIWKERFVKTQH
ncbi:MAG: T9SS type A sorting domain-containing protein [Ginsengibacter sp.]